MTHEYTYSNYWAAVNSYAIDILERSKSEGEDIQDLLMKAVDGSSWVFMYFGAKQCIEHSSNSDAYEDMGMELDGSKGFDSICTQVAFWALYTDIQEAITELEDEMEN